MGDAMAERRILITGAASGIGAGCVRALAAPGVALVVHTRKNQAGAEALAAEARALGAIAHVLLGDLALAATPARLVADSVAALGGLDVVVSNAGFADRTPIAALPARNSASPPSRSATNAPTGTASAVTKGMALSLSRGCRVAR